MQAFLSQQMTSNSQESENRFEKDRHYYAKMCLQYLRTTGMYGARKTLLSATEVSSLLTRSPMITKVLLLDGQSKTVELFICSTAGEIVKDLCQKIGLKESYGWSLFQVRLAQEFSIRSSDYFFDFCAITSNNLKMEGPSKKQKILRSEGIDEETKYVMKKRLFKLAFDLGTDPLEFHLLYSQISLEVLSGKFLVSEKSAIQLAALKAQITWGDYDENNMASRFADLTEYLPKNMMSRQSNDAWIKGITEYYGHLMGKSALQAKVIYVETIKQMKLFGAALFPFKFEGFWNHPQNVLLGISMQYLFIVQPKTHNILETIDAASIVDWEESGMKFTIKKIIENSIKEFEFMEFKGERDVVMEIHGLMTDYYGINRALNHKKDAVAAVNFDPRLLESDIEKYRKLLVDNAVVRIPGPTAYLDPKCQKEKTRKLFGMTVKSKSGNTSAGMLSNVMNIAGEPINILKQNGIYCKEDWSFSKEMIFHSLLAVEEDQFFEEDSLVLWSDLMTFAGIHHDASKKKEKEATSSDEASFALIIQDILSRAIENPLFKSELYLQLIKQTTDVPQADIAKALQYWKVLAIACWITLPDSTELLDYCKAHVRKYAFDSKIVNGRKEENLMALYCYKALNRNLSNKGREFPPSFEELKFLIVQKECHGRFYFQDGQFRAIQYDSATTAQESCLALCEKLKISHQGYALYERFAEKEDQPIAPDEKICDIIFKWEAYKAQLKLQQKEKTGDGKRRRRKSEVNREITDEQVDSMKLQFILKKRLYLGASPVENEIEDSFLIYDGIENVMNGRHPISLDDAIKLAALRIQMEYGDQDFVKIKDYKQVIDAFIPSNFLMQPKVIAQLELSHGKLFGKTLKDIKSDMLQLLKSWEFFGTTMFIVDVIFFVISIAKLY